MNERAQHIRRLTPGKLGERDKRPGLHLGKLAVERHHAAPAILIDKLSAGQLLDFAKQLPLDSLYALFFVGECSRPLGVPRAPSPSQSPASSAARSGAADRVAGTNEDRKD